MEVYSDKKRKPRYFVTVNGIIVHQGDDGAKVLQWAVDHCGDESFDLTEDIYGSCKLESRKKKTKVNENIK